MACFFSEDTYTQPWTEMNAKAGWSDRLWHTSVAMPDGSIVLMGGQADNQGIGNDVWRSTDYGRNWTQMTAYARWSGRVSHSSVATPDGSLVVMGGQSSGTLMNDVWRSTDNGATWTLMTPRAEWSPRYFHSSVVMPDGSIVLMGGIINNRGGNMNDVWRSTDNGTTWTLMTASAG